VDLTSVTNAKYGVTTIVEKLKSKEYHQSEKEKGNYMVKDD